MSLINTIASYTVSVLTLIKWGIKQFVKYDFNTYLKPVYKGKSIDVIVNGPSFSSQQDIVLNDGREKCMVNYAANTSIFFEIKPAFYCVADPNFFLNQERPEMLLFIENMKKIDWDMTFLVSLDCFNKHVKNSKVLNFEHVKFLPYHASSLNFSFSFKKLAFRLFKKGWAMPSPFSVSLPAIMNAINLGFSEIYLYGYDHNWIHNVVVDDHNIVCLNDTHFYGDGKQNLKPWKKNETETFKMHEVLKTQVDLFEAYYFIKEYVEYLGNVKVINKSRTSLLDAFERG